jgi:hypothetical protein
MKMDKVEHYAKIVLVARQLGTAQPLTPPQVRKLLQVREDYEANKVHLLSKLE